jgi:uncharacterized protein (TIGR00369 family)
MKMNSLFLQRMGRISAHMSRFPQRFMNISVIPPSVSDDQKFLGLSGGMFIKVAEDACPFIRDSIECKVTHLEPGVLHMNMPFKPEFVGNPVTKVLHGGVVASLIDHVGGFCAMSCIEDGNTLMATVDMRIDYINPAPPETIHCEAIIVSRKKTLIRSDVVAWNADKSRKIAIGRVLYNSYRSDLELHDTMIG